LSGNLIRNFFLFLLQHLKNNPFILEDLYLFSLIFYLEIALYEHVLTEYITRTQITESSKERLGEMRDYFFKQLVRLRQVIVNAPLLILVNACFAYE